MKRFLSSLCFLLVGFHLSFIGVAQADVKEHKLYRVVKVIDGDTIKLDNGELVRLIGIDAPEIKGKKAELSRGLCSRDYAKQLMDHRKVRLEFDKRKRDQYHRVLAYVFLSSGIFVNAQMVSAGYASVYNVKPDLRHTQIFRQLYREAKQKKRGLWKEEPKRAKHLKWFKSSSKNPYTNK